MLDLVPFARAGRKVTHRNRQSLFRCEGLQLSLPQLETIPVAPPAVSADQWVMTGVGLRRRWYRGRGAGCLRTRQGEGSSRWR